LNQIFYFSCGQPQPKMAARLTKLTGSSLRDGIRRGLSIAARLPARWNFLSADEGVRVA
jgi:hypothetical protein